MGVLGQKFPLMINHHVGPKFWQTLPREVKEFKLLKIFKRNIKTINILTAAVICVKVLFEIRFFCNLDFVNILCIVALN